MRHRLCVSHALQLLLLLLLLLQLLYGLLLFLFILVLRGLVHGVVDEQLEGVVAVLVHFYQHLKASPSSLRTCQYLLLGQFSLLLLPLIPVNLEVTSRNTVLVECLVSKSNGLCETVYLPLIAVLQEKLVIKSEQPHTRGLGHDPEHQVRVVEHRVLADVVALLQRLEHMNVSLLVHDFEVDFSVDYEVNVLTILLEP